MNTQLLQQPMSSAPSVTFADLESAFMWVSAAGSSDNAVRISKATGQIFYSGYDTEDELPDDIDDATLYCSVPHQNDLDLGRELAFDFMEEYLPEQYPTVQAYFHKRGAYSRFKDLLDRQNQLDQWYAYERKATETALLAWAYESGLSIDPGSGGTGA